MSRLLSGSSSGPRHHAARRSHCATPRRPRRSATARTGGPARARRRTSDKPPGKMLGTRIARMESWGRRRLAGRLPKSLMRTIRKPPRPHVRRARGGRSCPKCDLCLPRLAQQEPRSDGSSRSHRILTQQGGPPTTRRSRMGTTAGRTASAAGRRWSARGKRNLASDRTRRTRLFHFVELGPSSQHGQSPLLPSSSIPLGLTCRRRRRARSPGRSRKRARSPPTLTRLLSRAWM
mmetsp:Transcript_39829/g.104254  ORF Transcript_39829/g.104254 Transcript_39829/m.104254 type:complete len:234 (+) Transcript_39829:1415-2116(+)